MLPLLSTGKEWENREEHCFSARLTLESDTSCVTITLGKILTSQSLISSSIK